MKQLFKIFILLFPVSLFGQSNKNLKVPAGIAIGMDAPKELLGKTVDGKVIPPIGDLPQDLVILDFMNTACTSCIAALPRLGQLQQANNNKLKIISISYEKIDRVKAFRKNNELFRSNKLDFIVEDSIWAKYFPHQTVSHMVWIYKGNVIAITHSEYVSQEMVDQVIRNGKINLPIKDDFLTFDFTRPLIGSQAGRYSFLTGFIEGANSNFGHQVDSVNGTVREYIVNGEIIAAYLYCYGKLQSLPFIKDSRIVVERSDKQRFVFDKIESKYRESWRRKYGMSYEANFEIEADPKDKARAMIPDMEIKMGVKTTLESRSVVCWVIMDDPDGKKAQQIADGQTIADFAFMLDLNGDIPPVINESNDTRAYNFNGASGFKDVQTELKKKGFILVQQERNIPCLVIR